MSPHLFSAALCCQAHPLLVHSEGCAVEIKYLKSSASVTSPSAKCSGKKLTGTFVFLCLEEGTEQKEFAVGKCVLFFVCLGFLCDTLKLSLSS